MSALRIGVLSFAHTHALSYLSALQAMPDVEVVGTDPDGTSTGTELVDLRGRELADALGVAYVDTVEELLASGVAAWSGRPSRPTKKRLISASHRAATGEAAR